MRYVLEDLLRVRRFREDAAANVVIKQRARVSNAEQDLARRRRELEDFVAARPKREAALYAKVLLQQVMRKDIDDMHLALQDMQLQEESLQQQVRDAEQALEEARRALEESQVAYRTAVKAREKLDEHKSLWLQEALKEAEDFEDKELEDFRVKVPEKDAETDDEFAAAPDDEQAEVLTVTAPGKTPAKRSRGALHSTSP